MKAPPRRLFREKRPPAPRIRDAWEMDPGDDRRFHAFLHVLGPAARREFDRLSDEAGTTLMLLFFARYRGWPAIRLGKKVIDLAGGPDGWGRIVPENLPEPLRRAWEAIQP